MSKNLEYRRYVAEVSLEDTVKSNPRERICPFSVQPDLRVAVALSPTGCWEPLGVISIRDDRC